MKLVQALFTAAAVICSSQLYAADAANMSSRANVGTGPDKLNASVVVTGPGRTEFLARALGPSMNVAGKLMDPVLTVVDVNTQTVIIEVDDWGDDAGIANALISRGLDPSDPREAAVILDMPAGAYTVQVTGYGGTTGVGQASIKRVDDVVYSEFSGVWAARNDRDDILQTTAGFFNNADYLVATFLNTAFVITALSEGPITYNNTVVTVTFKTGGDSGRYRIQKISNNTLKVTFIECQQSSCGTVVGSSVMYDRLL